MSSTLQTLIETAWDQRADAAALGRAEVREAVEHTLAELDAGRLRVAERQGVGQWKVNQWAKKAVLLSFRLNDNRPMQAGELTFFDKVPTKFAGQSEAQLRAAGVRVVPPAVARRGHRGRLGLTRPAPTPHGRQGPDADAGEGHAEGGEQRNGGDLHGRLRPGEGVSGAVRTAGRVDLWRRAR